MQPVAIFNGNSVTDFIYWIESEAGLRGIGPKEECNFIKAHFSKTVRQEHDDWIAAEKVKSVTAKAEYLTKDVADLIAWLKKTYQLRDSKVTITNLHALIERMKTRSNASLLEYRSEFSDIVSRMTSAAKPDGHTLIKLFLQGCTADNRRELVKHSVDSSRAPSMDFDGFLKHVDTQDSHNQILDQVIGSSDSRDCVFVELVTPPIETEVAAVPAAPVTSSAPAPFNIEDLATEFSKMALHVGAGKSIDTYQSAHSQLVQVKVLFSVVQGSFGANAPPKPNGGATVANGNGGGNGNGNGERKKFDVSTRKCFFCAKTWKENPEGKRHVKAERCQLLKECIRKGWPITEDLRNPETGEIWRMKDGKSIYKQLKNLVESSKVGMFTAGVHNCEGAGLTASEVGSCAFNPVVLDNSDEQYLRVGEEEYRLLTEVMGVIVGEPVTEKEAWDAWAEFGGLEDSEELPEVPCDMIGEVVRAAKADAMAKRMREEEEATGNKRVSPRRPDYQSPATSKAPHAMPAPKPVAFSPPPRPEPVPPEVSPAAPPKPAARYQYKKSTEMAAIDLDKRTIEILSRTTIEMSAMDLIAF
ncbi:hypothetical protein HDU80_002034, partial [Chytriomyces hyalinus]